MNLTKEQLVEKGWEYIGNDGLLEYFAKEDEHGEIMFIPVHEGKTVANIRSINKSVAQMISNFAK